MEQPPDGFATRRRTELFDALVDLILVEGFAHLTLDEIATRLRCSKSTLYTLAGSKEQLVRAATVHFFRRATESSSPRIADDRRARERITAYLSARGHPSAAASDRFMTDLDAFAPAREVYERNTASPPAGPAVDRRRRRRRRIPRRARRASPPTSPPP